MCSFAAFKYVNFIMGDNFRFDFILGDLGEKLNYFQGLGSSGKNTFRELRKFFRDLGRSIHYFKGAMAKTPLGPQYLTGWYQLIELNSLSCRAFVRIRAKIEKNTLCERIWLRIEQK